MKSSNRETELKKLNKNIELNNFRHSSMHNMYFN